MTIDLVVVKNIIIVLASLITSLGVICAFLKKMIDRAVDKITQPILTKIDKLDENHCKDFLMSFLTDIENGIQKNQFDIARAYDVYNHYTNVLHKNSYIHARWEAVMGSIEDKK